MAAQTFQTVLDLARETLNDDDKVRHTDTELIKYANDGVDEMFNLRPDLFIGFFSLDFVTNGAQYATTDTLPFQGTYKRALADYIIFRTETKEDESVVDGRATMSAQLFSRIAS